MNKKRIIGTVRVKYENRTLHEAPVYEGESPYGAVVNDRVRQSIRTLRPTCIGFLPFCVKRFHPASENAESSKVVY